MARHSYSDSFDLDGGTLANDASVEVRSAPPMHGMAH
jgi:hypothetical protein